MSKEVEVYTPFPLLLGVNAQEQTADRSLTFVSDSDALDGLARHVRSSAPRRVVLGYSQNMTIQAPDGALAIEKGDFLLQPNPPFNPDKDLMVSITDLDEDHITERLATNMYHHPVLGAHARRKAAYYRRLAACGALLAGSSTAGLTAVQTGHSGIAIACATAIPAGIIGIGMNYLLTAGPAPPLRSIPADLTPPIRIRSTS